MAYRPLYLPLNRQRQRVLSSSSTSVRLPIRLLQIVSRNKNIEPPNEDELSFNIGDGSAETNAIDLLTQELREEISQGMVNITRTESRESMFHSRSGRDYLKVGNESRGI